MYNRGTALPPLLNYDSSQEIRAFLDKNGLGMRKKLGQNFLINRDARRRLLDALDAGPGDRVWEIGPGLGAMTAGLLDRGAEVTSFEIDRGFIKALGEFFKDNPRFTLIAGDVFRTWPLAGDASFLLGNLPYNIAAAILGDLIEKGRFFIRIVVTVQREVARRMIARPGSADYSSFSVLCASVYTIKPLMVLKGASFYPPPRVDSQGVLMELRTGITAGSYPPLFKSLVRSLFAARRKTIKNNLQSFLNSGIINAGMIKNNIRIPGELEFLKRCGIAPNERAENLGIPEFTALAAAISAFIQ
jgi:16S rRNA (adenine1518-N6/adenine1519-N6)-dimethyltransferase